MTTPINTDADLEILTFDSLEGQHAYRLTSSHILAQAVLRLFPGIKLAIGPAIADGFYYDFDTEHTFTPDDLEKIEAEMVKIIKEDLPLERKEVSREEALQLFKEKNEKYKVELIEVCLLMLKSPFISRESLLICAGPHLLSTGKVKAVKLMSLAGLIGVAVRKTRCYNVFMVHPFLKSCFRWSI